MFFIMIWNLFTHFTPMAQLPNAEHWPAAFRRGLSKINNVPVLSNPRIIIPMLVILTILYILASLNMPACRRAIARLHSRSVRNRLVDVAEVPYSPGIRRDFTPIIKSEAWYYRPVAVLTTILNGISGINRRIVAFFKSQDLKNDTILALGSILCYRFYSWMGDPMGILVEPNYLEWGGFMSTIRLNLYRAKSFDFVFYALYITFAVNEYGFQPILIALSSLLLLVIAYLAQAMSFMDRQSPEWQRAAMTEPRSGIPEDEGILTLLSGLVLVMPFLMALSWLAHKAHEQWRLVPRGPIKAASMAVVMFIPTVIVAGMRAVWFYLGAVPSSTDRNSEVDQPRIPIKQPFNIFKVKTPVQPPAPTTPRPVPRPQSRSSFPAPAAQGPASGYTRSQTDYEVIKRLPFLIMDLLFSRIKHLAEAILEHWMIFGPIFFLLALVLIPVLKGISFGTIFSFVFGWMPRMTSYIASLFSRVLQRILGSLDDALLAIEEAARVTPGGAPNFPRPSVPHTPSHSFTSSLPFTPRASHTRPARSTPWDFSFLWKTVSWIPGKMLPVFDGLNNILLISTVSLERVFGKFILNSLLAVIAGSLVWFDYSMCKSFQFSILFEVLLFIPTQIITSQLISYLVRSEISGPNLKEKKDYAIVIAFILVFRALKALVHGKQRPSSFSRPITRPCSNEYEPSDVTVIIPMKGSYVPDDITAYGSTEAQEKSSLFLRSLSAILANEPAEVIIATTGLEAHKKMNLVAARFGTHRVKVTSIMEPVYNLRRQFLKATDSATTDIICYAHAEVRWKENFLKNALAPFNDPDIGLVGVPVEMKRSYNMKSEHLTFNPKKFRARILQAHQTGQPPHPAAKWLRRYPFKVMNLIDYTFTDQGACYSILNYLECLHYQHFNHESASTNRIDGAVALVSAKSALIRTCIVQSTDFRFHFPHEKILGLLPVFGGMRSDAAHFITRKVREMGYQTVFQDTPSTTVQCVFNYWSLHAYCEAVTDRYSSMYRSNLASLRNDIFSNYPWTAYTMILSLMNASLIFDGALSYLLWFSGLDQLLLLFVLATLTYRAYEQYPHLRRYPGDWKLLPFGISFGYLESIFQIMGLLCAAFPEAEPEEPYVHVGFKGFGDGTCGG
ncbi:hypothetical protein BKA65DRAFT_600815 [Rhexocercosporidium sp. MPI-PUGE-AT-0058]|nr:hypothetical protein BKA65DRAFT_600815 [Rhexocercosporidium sp. MPI-PUGE-AT-0058]